MFLQISPQLLKRVPMITAVGVILILLAFIIFRKPEIIVTSDKEKVLRDSLTLMQREVDSSHVRQARIQNSYDSLLGIEPEIKYRTNEKIKFIFNTASPTELDSIIRTNWKTNIRHH